jgi:glutathione S-transferase
MRLYDFPASPNCRKVRAVVYELGLQVEFVPVSLFEGETRKPAFLALNPNGRVPVLQDGDFVLWESNAIMAYLAAKHPSPSLLPAAPRERADVDRWMSWQLAHLGPAIAKVAFERVVKPLTGRGPADAAAIEAGTADYIKHTGALEDSLGGKEYLAGRLSVADFALAAYYSLAAPSGLEVASFPKTNAWLGRVLARDSMRRALAEAQQAMAR